MHMADALLAPTVAVTMYAATGAAAAVSLKKLKVEDAPEKLPMMGVMSAFVFAGQMINYTIPGTGASGHICGGLLLSAMLGPYAGFLSMIVILAIQCLFFADGGLMALGANVWNMAFYGCFVGYFLIYRPILRRARAVAGAGKENAAGGFGAGTGSAAAPDFKAGVAGSVPSDRGRVKKYILLASVLGCVITLQMGAFSVCVETFCSGITELPFAAFLALMQPIHLAIGLVEGLVTAAVLTFVYQAREELLWAGLDSKGRMYRHSSAADSAQGSAADGAGGRTEREGKTYLRPVLFAFLVAALFIGMVCSRFASSNPDGLEWSLFGNAESGYSANMALDEEDYGAASELADSAGALQEKTALFPDYSAAETLSGPLGEYAPSVFGTGLLVLIAALIYAGGRIFHGKRSAEQKGQA